MLGVKSGMFQDVGINKGFISHHVCCLDGTNNGYQHIAGLISNQSLANKVNLQNVKQPQDLYKQILDVLLMLLKYDKSDNKLQFGMHIKKS